jgi:hypothetical protein
MNCVEWLGEMHGTLNEMHGVINSVVSGIERLVTIAEIRERRISRLEGE